MLFMLLTFRRCHLEECEMLCQGGGLDSVSDPAPCQDSPPPSQVKGGQPLPMQGLCPPSHTLPGTLRFPQQKTFCTMHFNEVVIKDCRRSVFQFKPIFFLEWSRCLEVTVIGMKESHYSQFACN